VVILGRFFRVEIANIDLEVVTIDSLTTIDKGLMVDSIVAAKLAGTTITTG
jgi:hypothetical protein